MSTSVYLYEELIYYDEIPKRYYGFTVSFTGHIESTAPFDNPRDRQDFIDALESIGLNRWDSLYTAGLLVADVYDEHNEAAQISLRETTLLPTVDQDKLYALLEERFAYHFEARPRMDFDAVVKSLAMLLELAIGRTEQITALLPYLNLTATNDDTDDTDS